MNPEIARYRDALKPPAWTTSKQRSSVDDIYTELDWLKTYLVERDIWDSACWAHYTRLRLLCATHVPKPVEKRVSPPMFYCDACQRRFFNKGWHAEACGSPDYHEL